MSIEPIGTAEVDLTDVVEYREVGEKQEDVSEDGTEASAASADGENARYDNFTAHSAKTPTSRQKPFQTELLDSASTLPLWQLVPEPVTVSTGAAVGDSVRYRFVDEDEEAFVTLVPYESNPNLGMINVDTPVGRALRGRADGDECEVMLPTGKRRIRVVKVEKRSV
jgi:transcription elongation factor GreA